jgi:hypothetical protein
MEVDGQTVPSEHGYLSDKLQGITPLKLSDKLQGITPLTKAISSI